MSACLMPAAKNFKIRQMRGHTTISSRNDEPVIIALQAAIARLERGSRVGLAPGAGLGTTLRFGVEAIDRHLPQGGLGPGLHELAGVGADLEHATTPALLVASLLGRGASQAAQVIWVTARRDLFAPGLAVAGLAPGRLLVVEAGRQVLASMEEAARYPGLAAVIGEPDQLDLTASRRLLLAAESSGVPVLAIRRLHRAAPPGTASPLDAPNAALTRWRISALPSRPADSFEAGPIEVGPFSLTLGRALWRLDLIRARGTTPASWTVEAFDETGRLAQLPVSPDRSVASAPGRPGSAWAARHRVA